MFGPVLLLVVAPVIRPHGNAGRGNLSVFTVIKKITCMYYFKILCFGLSRNDEDVSVIVFIADIFIV